MKPVIDEKLKRILDAAHQLDAALIDIFTEEPLELVSWIDNKGLRTIPETIFLRPWMTQEHHNLTLIWQARNNLFELLAEIDDRPIVEVQHNATLTD